ncbi:MAG: VirB8/TrbF family protein [Pseudomonadota bacterium]
MSDLTPQQKEYNDFIKSLVADGSYFKDARDWYIFRYVQPICERTILFFIVIITGFVTYILAGTILNSLPIKQEVAVIIRPKDQSRYFPVIKSLKDSVEIKNIDQAVSKYLLAQYVKKREGYDLRKTNIEALNNQMNYIKNNSSIQEYRDFQSFLSKNNPDSPIIYFGRDFQRIVDIDSVEFPPKETDNLIDTARYFVANDLPNNANVKYTITTKVNSVVTSTQRYLVKINFKFSGVNSKKSNNSGLDFTVISYKIYKIK